MGGISLPSSGVNWSRYLSNRRASPVFGHRIGDLVQQRLDKTLQHGDLIKQRGVEHHVGLLLVRENMQVFAPAHALPTAQRRGRIVAACTVIAHDTADQPVVGRCDTVHVVHGDGSKGRHVDLKLQLVIDMRRQAGIQAVDTFDNQHRTVVHLQAGYRRKHVYR